MVHCLYEDTQMGEAFMNGFIKVAAYDTTDEIKAKADVSLL